MNRQTAIILTIASVLLCGLPGIGLICFSAFGIYGASTPGFYDTNPGSTPQDVWLGAVTVICLGLVLLVIPVLTGFLSFKASQPAKSSFDEPPFSAG